MEPFVPLAVIDDFLLEYNVGQAMLLLLVLAVLGSLPLKSRRVLALNLLLFGLIFVVLPNTLAPIQYRLLGIGLLVFAPVLYVSAGR